MQGEKVGSTGKLMQPELGAIESADNARLQQQTGFVNFLPDCQESSKRFLKSRILKAALKHKRFPKLNFEGLAIQPSQALQLAPSNTTETSGEISSQFPKVNSPQLASSAEIRTLFKKNTTVIHSFHGQLESLESSIEKVYFGLRTIEAAKAEGTEASLLQAQAILASLGWRKNSKKRGRKPHCPLLKEICGGIKQEIEQKELKKVTKRKLHQRAKEVVQSQSESLQHIKKALSSEGLSMLRMEIFTPLQPRHAQAPAPVPAVRVSANFGNSSFHMEEEKLSSNPNPEQVQPARDSSQFLQVPNNNEDLVSVFGGHGSILSFRYLQRRKGSSSSYFQSVLGALKEKTDMSIRNPDEGSAKKSYLGGEGFLSSLVGGKSRLLEDQASIGPELSLYLANSGSYRMFGDPTYDVEY